jgi:hypothetical protein
VHSYLSFILKSNSSLVSGFTSENGKPALMCIEKYPEPQGDQEHYCHRHHLAEELQDNGYFRKREDILSDGTSLTDFA